MTPTEVLNVIKEQIKLLPWEFTTRDTFRLFDDPYYQIRCYACMALRRIEREGLISCVGFGTNRVCIWRKNEPRPMPEWI